MFFFNLNPRKRQLKLVTFTTQMRICTIDVLNLKKTLSFLIPFNKRLSSQNRNKPKRKTNASENQRDQCFKPLKRLLFSKKDTYLICCFAFSFIIAKIVANRLSLKKAISN